jgi:hypothetical protein
MSKPFKGTINVDIRDSVPDWTPFEPPKAPEGAPNCFFLSKQMLYPGSRFRMAAGLQETYLRQLLGMELVSVEAVDGPAAEPPGLTTGRNSS